MSASDFFGYCGWQLKNYSSGVMTRLFRRARIYFLPAVLLPNAKVLVTGGQSSHFGVAASAKLFQ